MKAFEYAAPTTETEAIEMFASPGQQTSLLAGGTDLVSLMKQELVTPDRVIDLKKIPSLKVIERTEHQIQVGLLATLDEMQESSLLEGFRSIFHVINGIRSIQIQSMGTLGGDLCHLPNCWYFRNGYGLLAHQNGESLVEQGDHRYHAIFNNNGPAKFVSASRFAPTCIAWGASVRIIGPKPNEEKLLPLVDFYQTPLSNQDHVTCLQSGQIVTHLILPLPERYHSATYEVLETTGLDWPLVSSATTLQISQGIVREASIVLGHVAPTPHLAETAASFLMGKSISEEVAHQAGVLAVASATPLPENQYKVQLAQTAVKRSILKAANLIEEEL